MQPDEVEVGGDSSGGVYPPGKGPLSPYRSSVMTSGTRTEDHLSLAECYRQVNGGTHQFVSFKPVGFHWTKSWDGSNYPALTTKSIFERQWSLVDAATVVGVSRPKKTYVERWVERHAIPKQRRAAREEHGYTMSLSLWSDGTWSTFYTDPFPTYEELLVTTFRNTYGDGYSVVSDTNWDNNDTIALINKLRERIVGSDFDMGVFLGEGREALKLITESAIRIRKSVTRLRRGDFVGAAVALGIRPERAKLHANPLKKDLKLNVENLSRKWLELQYGWLPLLGDAQGGAEALAQQLNNPMVQTYRARKKKELRITTSSPNISNGAYAFYGDTRGQLIARLTEVNPYQLNGLLDPTTVLWELTPYSFVADWFIPIGDYLSARSALSSLTGTYIRTLTRRELFQCSSVEPQNAFTKVLVQPNYHSKNVTVDRLVTTNLEVPFPTFKPLAKVASWRHCANAVALLVGLHGSSRS